MCGGDCFVIGWCTARVPARCEAEFTAVGWKLAGVVVLFFECGRNDLPQLLNVVPQSSKQESGTSR